MANGRSFEVNELVHSLPGSGLLRSRILNAHDEIDIVSIP